MSYSLAEAAKAVGRTKPALLNAIQKGRISAKKNDFNQWEIDPAELHRVYAPVRKTAESIEHDLPGLNAVQIRELEVRLEWLEAANKELQAERDDWKRQADAWQLQAKTLALPAPTKGFWAKVFGWS